MTTSRYETRYVESDFEVRAKPKGFEFRGYAAKFGSLSSDLGGFVETVRAGAFQKTIQESDVRALFNHDVNIVLGRNRAGTLRLAEDSTGLAYEIDAPDTMAARDLATSMERGDITQSSFGFDTIHDTWTTSDAGYPKRSLNEVRLYDVSPVVFPAYDDTASVVAKRSLARHLNVDEDLLDSVDLRALLAGKVQSERDPETRTAEDEGTPSEPHVSDIAAMRRLLELRDLPVDIAQALR